jgi:hypothetical protein
MRILRAIIFGVSRIYNLSLNNSIHKTRRLFLLSRTSGLRYRCWYTLGNAIDNSAVINSVPYNTPTPDTLEIDIPSANLHVKGLDFVERISGVRLNPRSTEMEDENTDPQKDPDIQFQVRVKDWSDLKQQNRAKTLLTLSDEKMVKSLQHHRDILLIRRSW